jgi:hypothetical protein
MMMLLLFPIVAFAGNIDPTNKFAWGENIGWVNFAPSTVPGVTVADSAVSGYAWGENIGWINLGPTNGGVINDGAGNLSGYAWGENIGWTNFDGVKINPSTGEFSGYAWGENIGWINFAPDGIPVKTSWNAASPYTLTLTKSGNGSVKVNGDSHTLPWSGQFSSDAQVQIEAIADNGWSFSNWSGDLTGSANPATITLTGKKNITANFNQNCNLVLTINISPPGSGTVTKNPDKANYCNNEQVSLTAIPNAGYNFSSWSGADSVSGDTAQVTMNASRTVTAIFSVINTDSYILNVIKSGTGNGVVTSSPKGIDCGSDCNETYAKNTKPKKVTLKVKADIYSTFLGWSGDCEVSGTKTMCKLTMDSDKNVTASFGLPDIAVSPNSYDFGDITVKQSSGAATFTIQNNGTGNLKIIKVKIIGADAKMFKIKGSCKKTISAGGNCQSTITFKPASAGSKTAILQITSNDPDASLLEIPLSGTGI